MTAVPVNLVVMITGYDPQTLRELVDVPAVEARLTALGDSRSTDVLGEKAVLLRLLGRLDEALVTAEQAFRLEHFSGDRERLTRARMRRAQVFQFSGQLERALAEMTAARRTAAGEEWSSTEAFAAQHEGKILFDLGRYTEARESVAHALAVRERIQAPAEQIESSLFALAVIDSRITEGD